MMLRGAILNRLAREYLPRLRGYQVSFLNHIDLDSRDLHHSSLRRRREIGTYNEFLYERTTDLYSGIRLLLEHLGVKAIGKRINKTPLLSHRWRYTHSSHAYSYQTLENEYPQVENGHSEKENEILSVNHIDTSFWMPERPDLQPLIAHEIAHIFVRSHFSNFNEYAFKNYHDSFSLDILRIRGTLEDFQELAIQHELEIILDANSLTLEIACDFLAAAQKGTSFIYAHFIEHLGFNESFDGLLGRTTQDKSGIIIDNINYIKSDTLGQPSYENREWYLRLRALSTWMRCIIFDNKVDPITEQLLSGIEGVTEDLLTTYQNIATTPEQQQRERFWEELSNAVCSLIKVLPVTEKIKAWRNLKANDYKHIKSGQNGERKMPRSFSRLNNQVRDYLFSHQLWMKCQKDRPLYKISHNLTKESDNSENSSKRLEELINTFNHFYLDTTKGQSNIHSFSFDEQHRYLHPGETPLYRYIFDIPWQSAMMRARDVLYVCEEKNGLPKPKTSNTDIIETLHSKFPLGRDLFMVALEFHLHTAYLAQDRIATIVDLLNHRDTTKENTDDKETINDIIHSWLNTPPELHEIISHTKEKNDQQNNKIAGRKIKALVGDTSDTIKNIDIIKSNNLLPLINFCRTRQVSKINNIPKLAAGYTEFYNEITAGLYLNKISKTEDIYTTIKNTLTTQEGLDGHFNQAYLISKISISGTYAALRKKATEKDKPKLDKHTMFFLRHIPEKETEVFYKSNWQSNQGKAHEKEYYFSHLGYYDVQMFKPATTICRCQLPNLSRDDIDEQENFPSYFMRKEIGIPFRLNNNPWHEFFNNASPIATLLIKLKQRTDRLTFLYRLRIAIKNSEDTTTPQNIEDLGSVFHPKDGCFLLDGANDILLIFNRDQENENNKKITHHLERIHCIQNTIYEDFMVDRTALSYMTDTLEAFNEQESEENHALIVRIRLLEDRMLKTSITAYLENLKIKSSGIISPVEQPGQFDISFQLTYQDIKNLRKHTDPDNKSSIYSLLTHIISHPYLDQVETLLVYKRK